MKKPGIMLGLLLDQHASAGGVVVPFFGRNCSTSASAAIFALRYDCPLHTGICYRVDLAKWIVEFRQKRGGFKRVEELLAIPGISERKWKAIRDKVEVK